MAKKSKLDKCVRCKTHRAIVGAFTSYYGVGLKGKETDQGFISGARILSEVFAEAGQERRVELSAAGWAA
jgi:hypothetical protein